jgi:soluble lytic murein transglycosylase-like protein
MPTVFDNGMNRAGFAAALLFLLCGAGQAEVLESRCFKEASALFGHGNPKVLRAIAARESGGRCPPRHPANPNGSYDIGCMGINSSWLPTLRTRFGITERDLYEPCTNIHVGAWIYARNMRQFGDNWRAVGAYNAVSEHKRMEYAWKINDQLNATR